MERCLLLFQSLFLNWIFSSHYQRVCLSVGALFFYTRLEHKNLYICRFAANSIFLLLTNRVHATNKTNTNTKNEIKKKQSPCTPTRGKLLEILCLMHVLLFHSIALIYEWNFFLSNSMVSFTYFISALHAIFRQLNAQI